MKVKLAAEMVREKRE